MDFQRVYVTVGVGGRDASGRQGGPVRRFNVGKRRVKKGRRIIKQGKVIDGRESRRREVLGTPEREGLWGHRDGFDTEQLPRYKRTHRLGLRAPGRKEGSGVYTEELNSLF